MAMRFVLLAMIAALSPAAARVPVATPVGEARSCIPIAQIRQTLVRDDRTIDFIASGKRVYRNVLPAGCPSLGSERRFVYETSLTQLCSTDIITVLFDAPLMRGPSCGLGKFQPVILSAS
jgi:hypothetical protein